MNMQFINDAVTIQAFALVCIILPSFQNWYKLISSNVNNIIIKLEFWTAKALKPKKLKKQKIFKIWAFVLNLLIISAQLIQLCVFHQNNLPVKHYMSYLAMPIMQFKHTVRYSHIWRSMARGRGTDRYMKGSNVTDTWWHSWHTTCQGNTNYKIIFSICQSSKKHLKYIITCQHL